MTKSGGPAAIKGFRLQTAYILHRLLSGQPTEQFRPEGHEDLDILDGDGRAVEHVQVKAFGRPLQLADLTASDSQGIQAEPPYLRRALDRIRAAGTRETVVSFGSIGPELAGAWRNRNRDDERYRRSVVKKLLNEHYTDADITLLFSAVTFEAVTEEDQQQATLDLLRKGLASGDERWILNAISYWLLEQSERGAVVPLEMFHAELSGATRHLVEAAAYARMWGHTLRSLLPDDLIVSNPEALRQELYEGVGARPEHVFAGVDVRRPELLTRLDMAFEGSRIVIAKGVSGQGKSALAYRYLHEHAIPAFTFEVSRLQDITHARDVALAVMGRMRALKVPMWLLIDAAPGDTLWLEVLSDLSRIDRLRVLVTVREEDWTRSRDALDLIPHEGVELTFTAEDAHPIFEALTRVRPSDQFLGFDEAWRHYEERGPLLEFVYMVTHEGQRLRARLEGQVRFLERLWEDAPAKLDFLHAAAFAAATGARVRPLDLAYACGLSSRALKTTIEALEREHLLRVRDESILEGLHAVRSKFLFELLSTAETPLSTAFRQALSAVLDEDLELFALHALLTLPPQTTLPALHEAAPSSWAGRAGLVRALLWWGIHEHTELCREVIREAYQEFEFGWWLFLPIDLLGLRPLGLIPDVSDWSELTFLPKQMRRAIARLRSLVPRETANFTAARQWLAEPRPVPVQPATPLDWAGLAELAFYTGLWNAPTEVFIGLDLNGAVTLPLEEASEVHYGLSFVQDERLVSSRTMLRDTLVTRFQLEAPIAQIEDDGTHIKIHFPVPNSDDPLATLAGSEHENAVLDATLRRIQMTVHLFPNREFYAAQGYGHRIALLPMLDGLDNSVKNMPRENLPPRWGVQWNSVFHRFANREFLLEDWTAHALHQVRRRTEALDTLARMLDGLPEARAVSKRDREQLHLRIFLEGLLALTRKMESHQELPRTSVDPWGLAATTRAIEQRAAAAATGRLSRQFDARHHDVYLKALRSYMGSFANFLKQATEGLWVQFLFTRPQERNAAYLLRRRFERELRGIFLSLVNLKDVLERLPAMQAEFRARFGDRINEAELAALEAREHHLLQAAWTAWSEVARAPEEPARALHASPEEVEARHVQRLLRELNALRQHGIEVSVVESSERWSLEGPTLWLHMDVPRSGLVHDAAQMVQHALHHTLRPTWTHRWMFQVMLHAWHTIVIIPTRAGRPWRPVAWVISPLLLIDKPSLQRWWNVPPKLVNPELFARLGLPLWPVNVPPTFEQLQIAVREYFALTSRMRDLSLLADVPGITQEAVDAILGREDEQIRACEDRLQALVSDRTFEGVLGATMVRASELPVLLESTDTNWVTENFGEELFITAPQPEDTAAANAYAIGALLELCRLHFEDQEVETLAREAYTINADPAPTTDR